MNGERDLRESILSAYFDDDDDDDDDVDDTYTYKPAYNTN